MTEKRGDVLVAGAAGGIGRAAVSELRESGHKVIAVDIDADGLDTLPDSIPTVVADVGDPEDVEEIITAANPVDALVCCTGQASLGAVEDQSPDAVADQFRSNVVGPLLLCQRAVPSLREIGGRIVWVSSSLGRVPLPYHAPYSASKHAATAATAAIRQETGVDVSVIESGPVGTSLFERAAGRLPDNETHETAYNRLRDNTGGGVSPRRIAEQIRRAVEASSPNRRYLVGWEAYALAMVAVLPAAVRDRVVNLLGPHSGSL
jgi:Short-chain dehydrogenases of various substrate specificities